MKKIKVGNLKNSKNFAVSCFSVLMCFAFISCGSEETTEDNSIIKPKETTPTPVQEEDPVNENAATLTPSDFLISTDYCNERQALYNQSGYVYELWQSDTLGETCMKINEEGDFYVEWSNINNILSRKGKRPGTTNEVIEYSVQNNFVGNVFFGAYGWWRDRSKAGDISEIVEYYVVEHHSDVYRPSDGGDLVATYFVDGALYELYVIEVFGRPNVYSSGNDDFIQLKSIRVEDSLRDRGTITMKSHFDAWEDAGFPAVDLFEVSMKIEGFAFRPTRNEGNAYLQVEMTTDNN